jgi:UDP-N-acetylglucosamine 4,6-dehydratase
MKNKKILIIGGSGALGKTLLKRYHEKNKITVVSRDEHKHVFLSKQYKNVHFQIGDVKDKNSIMRALNENKPDIIINAAALKHVPICESNVYESVKTNIIGHQNLIDCVNSSTFKIEALIFISTDKACKPINVYGMSKAIAERLYVNFSEKQNKIKVIISRYGNVLESTGSVIPFFKRLLSEKECEFLPITNKNMTRFLMSLDDAVDLIEWSYNNVDSHGKIVVPKMRSLRITDVAEELSMSITGKKIDLKFIGIRPGEKINEEMISLEESLRTIECKDYYMISNKIINQNVWSYSSENNVLEKKHVNEFLKARGVI